MHFHFERENKTGATVYKNETITKKFRMHGMLLSGDFHVQRMVRSTLESFAGGIGSQ